MHRYQTNKPRSGANAPFKPPGPSNSAATAGSPFSVPATHGSSQQDRTDASTSRASAWPNNGPQGGSNHQGGYNNYNRSTSSSYGRQQDSAWDSRDSGGSDSFGYRPSSNKVVGMIDDFDDSVDKPNGVDKYGIDRKREAARQRDAPKSVVSPGKAQRKAAADYEDRLDNLHSYENNVREQRLAEDRKIKEKKEQQSKLKAAADEAKARALLRNSPEAQRNVSALPSSRRPSASSSANAQRKPATYSKKDKQRDRSASAAEERRRKERGETDEIEDADEESDGIEVMQSSKKGGKDAKGKGKQKEADVEMSSSERSKSHRAPPKKLPPVDIDALLKPNMPVSKSSSGRVSSPPRSSQAKTINLADSPEKPRAAKPAPPAFEMSPSPEPVDLNALIKKEREEEQKRADKEEAKAEKRREKEKKRIVLSPDEEEDAEDSEEAVRRELMEGSPRGRFSRTPDPLLWAEETRADPSTLCPFCSRALPATRSSTLSNLLEYLLARPDIVDYPTARNPGGKRLPVVQTASFCRLHEEEMVVIPKGIEKGWPTEIDWDGLPKRIDRQLSQHLSDIITGKTPSPFFEDAKKEWEAKGNKMKNLLSEYASFDVEQPGYYGSRGHELIVATVTRLFVTQTPLLAPFRCTPLDPAAYIRRVLVPETATQLIKADLFLPDDESAREVLRESRAFGRAMWQGGLEGKEEERKFIKEEERRERREEKEEEESQEKAAGGGGKGKAREVMTEVEREKEKKKEMRRKEKELLRRAEMVAKGLSVTNQSDDDDEEAKEEDRSTARRKPKVGNSVPSAAAPTKRKPKQQLNSERMAISTSASGSVQTSNGNGGGRSSESDSDSMEVTTIKKRKPQPKPQPPQVKRKPAAAASSTSASNSLSIPRSKAPSSSSSDDVPLPRVKAKSKTKLKTDSKSKPSSAASSSKSLTKSKPSALVDSDSDPFEAEIQTDFKKKKGKVAAPWETKRGKRKGAAGAGGKSDDDSPPPDSSSSSDDEMEVD